MSLAILKICKERNKETKKIVKITEKLKKAA